MIVTAKKLFKSFEENSVNFEGHRNSCYLDAMLFAMFSQTTVYDHLLDRIPRSDDVPQLKELQRILATEIVYPLRKYVIIFGTIDNDQS